MMTVQLEALTEGVRRHFRHVHETRMKDIPILNPALQVQTVGFQHTENGCLGVLITPWFISLMLLPCEGDDWHDLTVGSTQTHYFPSGAFDFLLAYDVAIGRYQTCSLLSPVLEMEDQPAAVAFAEAALEALMDPANKETREQQQYKGQPLEQNTAAEAEQAVVDDANPDQGCDRRNFLRGRFRDGRAVEKESA
jgi:[NiFe] hydrogenase assembly HybE family chaperone